MRSLLIFSIVMAVVFVGDRSFGQTNLAAIPKKPGVILIRVNSSLDNAMGNEFYSTRRLETHRLLIAILTKQF